MNVFRNRYHRYVFSNTLSVFPGVLDPHYNIYDDTVVVADHDIRITQVFIRWTIIRSDSEDILLPSMANNTEYATP